MVPEWLRSIYFTLDNLKVKSSHCSFSPQKAVQDLYDFRDHFFVKNDIERAIHKTEELGQELRKVIVLLDEIQSMSLSPSGLRLGFEVRCAHRCSRKFASNTLDVRIIILFPDRPQGTSGIREESEEGPLGRRRRTLPGGKGGFRIIVTTKTLFYLLKVTD